MCPYATLCKSRVDQQSQTKGFCGFTDSGYRKRKVLPSREEPMATLILGGTM